MKLNKGYTLVELLILFAILALMAAVIIPNVLTWGNIEDAGEGNETIPAGINVSYSNGVGMEAQDIEYVGNATYLFVIDNAILSYSEDGDVSLYIQVVNEYGCEARSITVNKVIVNID